MSRRFDHLGDVEAFVTVVEKGSMTTAAVALATTPSVLSRAITRLEARLGVQLLRRTTRRLSLTEQGRLYLEHSRAAFALIDEAERTVQGQGDELKGSVRLSAPTTYAHHRLPALLQHFSAQHPQVRIELNITNRNVDLVAEGYDLAIRMGSLPDSGLVARKLEDAAMCLIAAPSYIARAGAPAGIGDLARHSCLAFVMPSTGRVSPWILRADGRDVDWVPQGGLQVSDDVLGVVTLAQSGLGICQTYDFIAQDLIAQGRAVEVLAPARGRSRPFSVIYAPHRRLSSASRALIDSLVATTCE
ncbi:LysR substrate-binding domain-containing protein [Variovorax sp. Varisp85]|jgi:DNA-binding transcriptional LysR family regulator|uniref:LysR family transcriptional regulator n=1 Tax=unclassified Variovorax TaxID=663243 RepID=UPI0002713755|nr:LysR family transcriptional regulator [Variovorax sp. CF313]EJL67745.1 transcriptional regulator [Variovorax sp. CF313]